MRNKILYLTLFLACTFFFFACGDDDNDSVPTSTTEIVGSWIEDGRNENGQEVFHMEIYSTGKFYEYVTNNGVTDKYSFTGTWSYSAPTLTIQFSTGEKYNCTVSNNRFTLGDIKFRKQ